MRLCISLCLLQLVNCVEVPIIGILAQEIYSVEKYVPNENVNSFIAASYVKYVESAGAKVVPILIGQDDDYYKDIVDHTNGLLLPGGATWFNESGGFGDAGLALYKHALRANKNGDIYPIFGICLGMELLAQAAIDGKEIRAHCSASDLSSPIIFEKEIHSSSGIFASMPETLKNNLETTNLTYNSHIYCLTKRNFTIYGLDDIFEVIATSKDVNGLEFIAAFEAKKLPFVGIQFHPEKSQFEFPLGKHIPHSMVAVEMAQFFSNSFVELARKNEHSFPSLSEERNSLIYAYTPTYVGCMNSSYEQLYFF